MAAEQLAATFLVQKGLKLVTQNYHCRFGEIDIVMMDAKTLVFIEVRLRTNSQFGDAAASITPQKQQKIRLAVQPVLQRCGHQRGRTALWNFMSFRSTRCRPDRPTCQP